jgi:hypothetical protein
MHEEAERRAREAADRLFERELPGGGIVKGCGAKTPIGLEWRSFLVS